MFAEGFLLYYFHKLKKTKLYYLLILVSNTLISYYIYFLMRFVFFLTLLLLSSARKPFSPLQFLTGFDPWITSIDISDNNKILVASSILHTQVWVKNQSQFSFSQNFTEKDNSFQTYDADISGDGKMLVLSYMGQGSPKAKAYKNINNKF